MKKILLDTDIGTDADDALCLAYLLAYGECDLQGITTVTGDPRSRAKIASALCWAADKDIPIFPGCDTPLRIEQHQKNAPQAAALRKWNHRTRFPENQAVHFLRDMIRSHPHEITLLTIGPLTNIARLFSIDPEIPHLLKELVGMNGIFGGGLPNGWGPLEWNIIGDPHAAAIVYDSVRGKHRSIGLDVTHRVIYNSESLRAWNRSVLLDCVLDFADSHFPHSPWLSFHDPLAALSVWHDDIYSFKRGRAEIELQRAELTGFTHWYEDTGGPHMVAEAIDSELFFERFFSVFQVPFRTTDIEKGHSRR